MTHMDTPDFASLARQTLYYLSSAMHGANERGAGRDITPDLEAYLVRQFAEAVKLADAARAATQNEQRPEP